MKTRFEKKGMIFEAILDSETGNILMTCDGELESEATAWKFQRTWVFNPAQYSKIGMKFTGGKQNLYLSDLSAEKFYKESLKIQVAIERAEKEKDYAELIAKLPEIVIPKTTPNEAKFNEIMSKISNCIWRGSEDDGMRISQSAYNGRIRSEARQYCNHEIETDTYCHYTADARKKVTRTISCPKCGLTIVDIVSDPVSNEAMWR